MMKRVYFSGSRRRDQTPLTCILSPPSSLRYDATTGTGPRRSEAQAGGERILLVTVFGCSMTMDSIPSRVTRLSASLIQALVSSKTLGAFPLLLPGPG